MLYFDRGGQTQTWEFPQVGLFADMFRQFLSFFFFFFDKSAFFYNNLILKLERKGMYG